MSGDDTVIGIDLGTTNSAVAVVMNGVPHILKNEFGKSTTPSIVHLGEKDVVGEAARDRLLEDPLHTIYASKRLIGRKFADVQSYVSSLPYKTYAKCNGDAWIKTDVRKVSPTEIGASILGYLRRVGEKVLGKSVRKAVVTVPAYFDDSQRQATKDAGKVAGLDVLRIINEPTAAALAYGMDKKARGHIAVYDLGGGTFDISILELNDGVFHVKATAGDTFLGGEDFDNELARFLLERFEAIEAVKIDLDTMAEAQRIAVKSRLKAAAEKAKKELSKKEQTAVYLDNIVDGYDLDVTVTRQQLESIVKKIAERTRGPCEQAIRDSKLSKGDIEHVLLVGGMTKMPAVQDLVRDIFGKAPCTGVDPDEAVALGAAVQAGILSGMVGDMLLLDVAPLSLGIEVLGGVFSKVVDRNTTIPCKHAEVFSTSEDGQSEVDIRIYQGERPMAKDNKYLGSVRLTGIPHAPRGEPKISVTFEVDVNGCVKVSAEDSVTKKPVEIKLMPSSGLTAAEVERMVAEAESKHEDDLKTKEKAMFVLDSLRYAEDMKRASLPEAVSSLLDEFIRLLKGKDFELSTAKSMLNELKQVL